MSSPNSNSVIIAIGAYFVVENRCKITNSHNCLAEFHANQIRSTFFFIRSIQISAKSSKILTSEICTTTSSHFVYSCSRFVATSISELYFWCLPFFHLLVHSSCICQKFCIFQQTFFYILLCVSKQIYKSNVQNKCV